MTETEGNSMFCCAETGVENEIEKTKRNGKEIDKRKNKANIIRKYMKSFVNFLKNVII